MYTAAQLKYMLALGELSENGSVRTVDLARTLNIQRSSVFNMLNKLEIAGIVEKKEDKTVELTEKGKNKVDIISGRVSDIVSKMKESFNLDNGKAEECALLILSFDEKL